MAAILFLDRPKEAAGFVEIDVIGPAVEGSKTLIASACSASAIGNPVGSCAVPSHANEEGTVVAPICRPPLLRVGHESAEIFFHGGEVEFFKFLGVVEVLVHGVGLLRVQVENLEIEALRHETGAGELLSCLARPLEAIEIE